MFAISNLVGNSCRGRLRLLFCWLDSFFRLLDSSLGRVWYKNVPCAPTVLSKCELLKASCPNQPAIEKTYKHWPLQMIASAIYKIYNTKRSPFFFKGCETKYVKHHSFGWALRSRVESAMIRDFLPGRVQDRFVLLEHDSA